MDEECTVEHVGSLLADAASRRILVAACQEPMSAERLSDHAGVSTPTVYRRLEDMRRCDLLVERTQLDTEGGHHRTIYATDLARIVVELDEAGFDLELIQREAMADRFTRLIQEM